jgi:hypothetical protein
MAGGLPQPSMFVYGQIYQGPTHDNEGEVDFTYTPQNGSRPVQIRALVGEIEGPSGETYSYSLMVPLELEIPGNTKNPRVLTLAQTSRFFTRSVTYNGEPIDIDVSSLGTNFSLNASDHVGFVERVDLLMPGTGECCPGDADQNLFVNLDDYRQVRDAFGDPRPRLGDADCNGFVNLADYRAVRDNFGAYCGDPESLKGVLFAGESGLNYEATIEAIADASEIASGDTLTVDLVVSSARGVSLAGVFVAFDPEALAFNGGAVNRDVFNEATFTGDPRLAVPGLVAFSGGTAEGTTISAGSIGTLSFQALKEGDASITLLSGGGYQTKLQDAAYGDVVTETRGTIITITAATAVNDWNLLDD